MSEIITKGKQLVAAFSVDFATPAADTWKQFYREFIDLHGKGPKYQISCLNTGNHKTGDVHKSAFVDTSTGTYHCSVCGSYGPERFLVDIIGISRPEANAKASAYKQGIVRQDNKFHLNARKALAAPMYGIEGSVYDAAEALDQDATIVQDYMLSRGIAFSTLQDWHVGWLPADAEQKEECLVFPYYFNGSIATVKGRTLDGRKGAPAKAKLVPYGLQFLENARFAVVVEGETDTLVTYQILKNQDLLADGDVAVVGIPGAAAFKKEWARFFVHLEQILIVPQADTAAETMIATMLSYLDSARVQVIELPWQFHDIGKDVSDWLGQHSEREFAAMLPEFREPQPYALTTTQVRELAKEPIAWIIPGLLAEYEKFMIFGVPKGMKTYVAIDMSRCIVQGKPVLGHNDWIPEAGEHRVLFIEEEGNPTQFFRRVDRNFGNDTEYQDNIMWVHKKGVRLDNPYSLERLIEQMIAFQPTVIFFDPFKSLHTADENDNSAMAEFWDIINKKLLSEFPNSSHVYVHHIPKSKQGEKLNLYSARGAGIIAAELDGGLGLRPDTEDQEDASERVLLGSLEGREIPSVSGELVIRVDLENFRMKIDGHRTAKTPKQQKQANMEKIYEHLVKTGTTCRISDIAHACDLTDSKTRTAVKVLLQEERIYETTLPSEGGARPKGYYV